MPEVSLNVNGTISATVIRADGTVEELGVISVLKPGEAKKWAKLLKLKRGTK